MRTELNNLWDMAAYIEIKNLMNKVSWKKTPGIGWIVSFEEKITDRAETSRISLKCFYFSQNLYNKPRIHENLHISVNA